ncbi:MAG TPA: hypothetical protein VGD15_04245 [Kribbella sp.]
MRRTLQRVPTAADDSVGSARVRANARLTALTGVVLLVLFVAQVVTVVLGVSSALTAHIVIGFVLTPMVVLKLCSTGWRMVRYYRGDTDFRTRGRPSEYYRWLGAALVAFTVVLFGSGLLAFLGPSSLESAALTTHKVSFYPWLFAVALHVVRHYLEAVRLAAADLFHWISPGLTDAGERRAIVLGALLVGVLLAWALIWHVADYVALH